MCQCLVFQDGQGCSVADAVVGTQRCPLRLNPVLDDLSLYGISRKIKVNIRILLAYHVEMPLEDDARCVFHSRGSLFRNHDVPHIVPLPFEVVLLRYRDDVISQGCLVSGPMRDFQKFFEVFPESARIELGQSR